MSAADNSGTLRVSDEFLRMWGESIAQVLGQVGGAKCAVAVLADDEMQSLRAAEADAHHLRFSVHGAAAGELAFSMSPAVAFRLGQTLLGEQPGAATSFTDDHRDACSEFFRQFAGVASTSCKPLLGGDVEFRFAAAERPSWTAETESGRNFTLEGREPAAIRILLNAELTSSLREVESRSAARAAEVPSEASPANPPPADAPPAVPVVTETNLALLLDVALDASLRFGQKQMLFKDVLDLRPGSVIELDRRVNEPAELLVAGRVIAKGEVVVVDGNYGLRITEVAQPKERLESINA
ncbi:MAG: flagellar motor switch protein FliN [Candidatus Acidiferrales bacterium]